MALFKQTIKEFMQSSHKHHWQLTVNVKKPLEEHFVWNLLQHKSHVSCKSGSDNW